MIKYKEIQSSSLKGYQELFNLRRTIPIKIIYNRESDVIKGDIYYTIPCVNTKVHSFWYHREDGPAIIENFNEMFFIYGRQAIDKKQFYNSLWRRKIEIEFFL